MPQPHANAGPRVLDLAHFIAAPLTALVEADAQAADTFRRFLEDVAFEAAPTGDEAPPPAEQKKVQRLLGRSGRSLGQLRCVSFSYDHMQNGRRVTSVIKVPLLSLLPLPALQVKEATFDFALDIVASAEHADPPRLRGSAPKVPPGLPHNTPRLLATLGSGTAPAAGEGRTKQAASQQLRVHVAMQNADMPAGLSTLLNLMAQSTNSVTYSPEEDDGED